MIPKTNHRSSDSMDGRPTRVSTPSGQTSQQNVATYPTIDAASPQQKLITALVNRLKSKLPHHSGLSLVDIETDESMQLAVETLIHLAHHRLDFVAWSLSELLQKITKTPQLDRSVQLPVEVMMSQLYILKVLTAAMTQRWSSHQADASGEGTSTDASSPHHSPWIDAPPVEEKVAQYILSVMMLFLRQTNHPPRRPRINGHTRTGSFPDFEAINLRGIKNTTSREHKTLYPFTPHYFPRQFEPGDSSARTTASKIPPSAFEISATTFHVGDSPLSINWLIHRYASRVIFHLSSSNWTVVFGKIRQKIHHFSNSGSESMDFLDMELIAHSALDRSKLLAVLQVLSSLLVNMGAEAQSAVSLALRSGILSWTHLFPGEFRDVIAKRIRLDGAPERVFDKLYVLSNSESADKTVLWPTLAALLLICPDRLSTMMATAYDTQQKKSNFIATLNNSLTGDSHQLAELTIACYMDFIKGFALAGSDPNSTFRSNAFELVDDVYRYLFEPAPLRSSFFALVESSNQELYCQVLVAIYRYSNEQALAHVFPQCLSLSQPDAVKLCALDAILTIVIEDRKYSTGSSLSALYEFAPSIRQIYSVAARSYGDTTAKPQRMPRDESVFLDDWTTDPSLSERDHILLVILALSRLDYRMFFAGGSSLDSQLLPEDFAPLLRESCHPAVRQSVAKSYADITGRLLSESSNSSAIPDLRFAASMMTRVINARIRQVLQDHELMRSEYWHLQSLHALVGFHVHVASFPPPERPLPLEPFNEPAAASEVLALLYLASGRSESVGLACDLLGLLGRAETIGLTSIGSYMPPEDAQRRLLAFGEISRRFRTTLGRAAQQKQIRNVIRGISSPFHLYTAAWLEAYRRWQALTKQSMHSSYLLSPTSPTFSAVPEVTETNQDAQAEWQNLSLFLAATTSCCSHFKPPSIPLKGLIRASLPERLHDLGDPFDSAYGFLKQMVGFLTSDPPFVRETAKDALSIDLSPEMFPYLFAAMDKQLSSVFNSNANQPEWEPSSIILVDQYVTVLKGVFDRVEYLVDTQVGFEIGRIVQYLLRFLRRSSNNHTAFRVKTKFCGMVDSLFGKAELIPMRKENYLRNVLVDSVIGWTSDSFPPEVYHQDHNWRTVNELDLTCLRCIAKLTQRMSLQVVDGSSSALDTGHVESRLFYRYFSFFMTIVDRWLRNGRERENVLESGSSMASSQRTRPMTAKENTLLWEYSLQGLTNLLESNTRAGLTHCLRLSYHNSARVREIFLTIFTNALTKGVDFDVLGPPSHVKPTSQLVELLKSDDLLLTLVTIEYCPPFLIDDMCEVLLNVFDTRASLMKLLKAVVDQEVDKGSNDVDLFRSNDMRNRLLSAFSRRHGYHYLQRILNPVLQLMLEQPPDHSYEVDPGRLGPGDDLERNIENVQVITRAFLKILSESISIIPPMIREICEHIANRVEEQGEEGREKDSVSPAIGAFIFLRFICPAIVQPQQVDINVPDGAGVIRRGLVLIAKIIQNLANNVLFGKEKQMVHFNTFLTDHIGDITKFVKGTLSATNDNDDLGPDNRIGIPYDETDQMILHRFFAKHADSIGKLLLRFVQVSPRLYDKSPSYLGKRTWDTLCATLVSHGTNPTGISSPTEQPAGQNKAYLDFLLRNADKYTGPVEEIFMDIFPGDPMLEREETTFIFKTSLLDIEKVASHVLVIHILRTLTSTGARRYHLLVDCTGYSSFSEIPIPWLKEFFEVLPFDLLSRLLSVRIVNVNNRAQRYLRKLHVLFNDFSASREIQTFTSSSEEFKHLYPGLVIPPPRRDFGKFYDDIHHEFPDVTFIDDRRTRTFVTMTFEGSYLRFTTKLPQPVYPGLKTVLTDFVYYSDIDDVFRSRSEPSEFVIRRGDDFLTMDAEKSDDIIKLVRFTKGKSKGDREPGSARRSVLVGDFSAILLNLGLINVCHTDAALRSSAFDLLCGVTSRLRYADNQLLRTRGAFVPANPASFAVQLSEKLAAFAPELTLDFLSEFYVGYDETSVVHGRSASILRKASTAHLRQSDRNAFVPPDSQTSDVQRTSLDLERSSRWQKSISLQYISPWIRNLNCYQDPSHPLFDISDERIRATIRILIDITMRDLELAPDVQRYIWGEAAKLDPTIINGIILDELVKAAIDAGFGTPGCEAIAEVFSSLNSINIRAKLLGRMRRVLAKTAASNTEPNWNEMGTLARLSLVAFYNSRAPVHTQVFVPELSHFITLLAGNGPLLMRATVYSMLINYLQSLCAARTDDPDSGDSLRDLIKDCSQSDVVAMFGLERVAELSNEYTLSESLDGLTPDVLERLTGILMKAIVLGAPTTGLANAWRARWMSLATSSAFQLSTYSQPRSFIVMGALSPPLIEDDLLYQVLVAFAQALARVKEDDTSAVVSMIRCLRRMVPALPREARRLPPLIWLAIALIQSSNSALYAEAAGLLQILVETLCRQIDSSPSDLVAVFRDARSPLEDVSSQIDDVVGLSFDTNFSLTLATILFKGARHPPTAAAAEALFDSLLPVAASFDVSSPDRPISPAVVGYFLALLSFCTTRQMLIHLASRAGAGSTWLFRLKKMAMSDTDDYVRVPFRLLGVQDAKTALLVVTFIITMLNSAHSEAECETLFALLAEASADFPQVVGTALDTVLPKINDAFATSNNPRILASVSSICDAVAGQASFSSASLSESSSDIHSVHASTRHLKALQEIGMEGMLNSPQFVPAPATLVVISWISELVHVMTNSY